MKINAQKSAENMAEEIATLYAIARRLDLSRTMVSLDNAAGLTLTFRDAMKVRDTMTRYEFEMLCRLRLWVGTMWMLIEKDIVDVAENVTRKDLGEILHLTRKIQRSPVFGDCYRSKKTDEYHWI